MPELQAEGTEPIWGLTNIHDYEKRIFKRKRLIINEDRFRPIDTTISSIKKPIKLNEK